MKIYYIDGDISEDIKKMFDFRTTLLLDAKYGISKEGIIYPCKDGACNRSNSLREIIDKNGLKEINK